MINRIELLSPQPERLTLAIAGTAKPRAHKEVPAACEVFGWCTWDAFYSRVSAAGIQEGLRSLAEGGAPPKLCIIDDGWQQTDVDPLYRQAGAKAAAEKLAVVAGGSFESCL